MRRRRPRAVVVAAVLALAGCAAIADLRDPEPVSETAPATGGDASTTPLPTSTTPSQIPVDAAVPDAYAGDGATTPKPIEPPPPNCVNPGKAPNGDPCKAPSECCSGACTQDKVCNGSCLKVGERSCDPTKTGECCFRTYCSPATFTLIPFGHRCANCLEKGVSAETARNLLNQTITLTASCCSGRVDDKGRCE